MSKIDIHATLAEYVRNEKDIDGNLVAEKARERLAENMTPEQIKAIIKQERDKVIDKQAKFKRAIRGREPCLHDLRAFVPSKDGDPEPTPADFAGVFIANFDFAKIPKDKDLLVKQDGVYIPRGLEMVSDLIEQTYPAATTHFNREVIEKIGRRKPTERHVFDSDPLILNCANGPFNLQTGDPARGVHFFRKKLAVAFKPELQGSKLFEQFMAQIMPDPNTRAHLLEACAAILLRDSVEYTKYTILQGVGANGKSTLLKVLSAVLGPDCVKHVSWQEIEHDRFATIHLEGAYANIFFDLPPDALKSTSKTKSLVDRKEPIWVQRKGIDGYSMNYTGRLMFSCNTLPELPDLQKADLRRINLFKFEEIYQGEDQDPDLLARLTEPDELSRILNSLLAAARELLQAGRPIDQDENEILRAWAILSSSSSQYAAEMVHTAKEGTVNPIKTATISQEYLTWCDKAGKKPNSITTLNKHLEAAGFVRRDTTVKGAKSTYWMNMARAGDQTGTQGTL